MARLIREVEQAIQKPRYLCAANRETQFGFVQQLLRR